MNLQLPFHLGLVLTKITVHSLNRVLFLFFQLWIYPRNVVDMVQAQNKLEFPRNFQGGFPEPILPQLKDPFYPFQRHSSPTQLTWSLCWVASKGFGHRRQSSQKQTWLVCLVVVVVVFFRGGGGWDQGERTRGGVVDPNGGPSQMLQNARESSLLNQNLCIPGSGFGIWQ